MDSTLDDGHSAPSQPIVSDTHRESTPRPDLKKGKVKKQRATPAAVTATYTQLQQIQQSRQQNEGDVSGEDGQDNIVNPSELTSGDVSDTLSQPLPKRQQQQQQPPVSPKPQKVQVTTETTIIDPTEQVEKLSIYESKDELGQDVDGEDDTPVKSGYASIHRSSMGKQNDLPDDMEELKKLVRQYQAQVRQATGSSPEAFISNVEATARLRIQLQQKLDSERQKYDSLLDENRRLALRIKELDKGVLPNYDAELQNRANQTVILHKKIKELTKERNQFQELYQKAVKRSEAEAQTLQKLHKDLFDTKQNNQRVVATLNAELTELRQKHQSLQMKIIELTRLLENEQRQRSTAENQMIALKSKAEHYFAHSVVNEVRGANKYEEHKKRKPSQSRSQLPEVFRQKNTGATSKQSESNNRSELPDVFNPKAKAKQQDTKQTQSNKAKPQPQDPKQKAQASQQKQAQNDKSSNRKPSMTNPGPSGKQMGQASKIPQPKNQKQGAQPAQPDKKGAAQKGQQQPAQQGKGANNKQLQLTKSQQQLKVVLEYNAWVPKNQNGKKK